MSSIRPLATITVLAAVGVFLYMKINETEAPLPDGVDDWMVGTELEFDMGSGTDPGAAPPVFNASPSGTSPNFTAGTTASSAGEPPAWTPPPVAAAAPPATTAEAPTFNQNATDPSETRGLGVANGSPPPLAGMPPLPALPPAASTVPVTSAAIGNAPSVSASDSPASTAYGTETSSPAAGSAPPAMEVSGMTPPAQTVPESLYGNAPAAQPPVNNATQAQSSLFSATRLHVQAALDRGELSQALLLLSDWYDDPSLSPSEASEVSTLLGQLAGSVIYSTEHRLAPPYRVQADERLETIAQQYDVPWQLLAKINGITSADQLTPGQELKVVRGPFSALIDVGQRKMTLMLDRRYAGEFPLDIDPNVTVEEGHWQVDQKLLTPAGAGQPGAGLSTLTEERSLMLANTSGSASQVAILRGATASNPLTEPAGRVMRLRPSDAADVFDILAKGSKVVIRR